MKKVLAAEPAREIDGTDGAEMLEFMQMGTTDKAEFQRITVNDDSAVLILSAQDEGHQLEGTVDFIKEGGQWKVMLSSWEEK